MTTSERTSLAVVSLDRDDRVAIGFAAGALETYAEHGGFDGATTAELAKASRLLYAVATRARAAAVSTGP